MVLFSHGQVTWEYLKDVKTNKLINITHSEVIDLEEPVDSSKIDLYIGIRPSIVDFINSKLPTANIKLIYNPFDFTRFNPQRCKKKKSVKDKVVLFPGSLDYLRYKPLKYLLDLSEKQNFKVLHVGRSDYSTVHPNFSSQPAVWDVENFYKQCDIVSGIFLGRTSIEGLLCGKKVLQFDVDNTGKIKEVYWHTEPYLDKFSREFVANQIIDEC
jgi:glycosyltransferase involved in cell wall biosynthesis